MIKCLGARGCVIDSEKTVSRQRLRTAGRVLGPSGVVKKSLMKTGRGCLVAIG